MALYFYMHGAFDNSLLKHSYFCHVFTRESAISQQNNIGLKASFQEFMHVYTAIMALTAQKWSFMYNSDRINVCCFLNMTISQKGADKVCVSASDTAY
jgi:hypothetical protein